jgi:hypothetical protein
MESVDAKIRRAKHHLSDLTQGLNELGRGHKPQMILKNDDQSAWLVVYYEEPYAPFSQSVVFGDFLHNLRSSLDALIYGVIRSVGQTPTRWTSFPICAKAEHYEERSKPGTRRDVLAGLPDEARAIVKALQPFMRGERGQPLDPLHQLNVMCNRDKHQASHIILGYAKKAHFALHIGDGRVIQFSSGGPLIGHGPWQIPIEVSPRDLRAEHRIEAAGSTEFLVHSDDPPEGRPVLDFAYACLQYVEDTVIRRFRPFFGERAG